MSDKHKMSETEKLFHSDKEKFKKIFGDDFSDKLEWFIEYCKFFYGPYMGYVNETKPLLIELAKKQYNGGKELIHTVQADYIDRVCDNNCGCMISQMNKLHGEYEKKIDMHEKYPKLEEWRKFYCNPELPKNADDSRKYYTYLNDEEWEKLRLDENRKFIMIHNFREKRKSEFYDIVQPRLFKHLPKLIEIEDDYWVAYAVTLRDNYEIWKSYCERLEIVNDYDMPPEYVDMDAPEFQKISFEYYKRNGRERNRIRCLRNYGEEWFEKKV